MPKASSSLLLLDVNVLISVALPNHQFHVAATRRLESGAARWATYALTQFGFIRLSSNPAAVPGAKSPAEAASLLASL
jgi:predicted nucleic acid-binding protein